MYLLFRTIAPVVFAFLLQLATISTADTVFLMDNTVPSLVDGLNNGDSITSDGITMTFSNVVTGSGSPPGDVEEWGILLASTTEQFNDVIQFDFSFDHDVFINTYEVGARVRMPEGNSFFVFGENGFSGANSIPDGTSFTEETLNFGSGGIPIFVAGQNYTFFHTVPSAGGPRFYLSQFGVTVIPEPNAVILVTGLFTAGIARRRR